MQQLTDREHAVILDALRCYQAQGSIFSEEIMAGHRAMTPAEVGDLAEKLNTTAISPSTVSIQLTPDDLDALAIHARDTAHGFHVEAMQAGNLGLKEAAKQKRDFWSRVFDATKKAKSPSSQS